MAAYVSRKLADLKFNLTINDFVTVENPRDARFFSEEDKKAARAIISADDPLAVWVNFQVVRPEDVDRVGVVLLYAIDQMIKGRKPLKDRKIDMKRAKEILQPEVRGNTLQVRYAPVYCRGEVFESLAEEYGIPIEKLRVLCLYDMASYTGRKTLFENEQVNLCYSEVPSLRDEDTGWKMKNEKKPKKVPPDL